MNCFLSPVNFALGPERIDEARTRSFLMAERQRAKTASPMRVTGMPLSRAETTVHFPVPFYSRAHNCCSIRKKEGEFVLINKKGSQTQRVMTRGRSRENKLPLCSH